MSGTISEEEEFIKDLGMTNQRMIELLRITETVMCQEAHVGEYGRTSHVLLSITARKDLNDLEKTVCTLIFATRIFKDTKDIGMLDKIVSEKIDEGEGDEMASLGFMKLTPTPSDIELKEMMDLLMFSIVSLTKQLPREEAKEFCRKESINLAKLSVTL